MTQKMTMTQGFMGFQGLDSANNLPNVQKWNVGVASNNATLKGEREIIKVPFTKEMKETHSILVPMMLPIHFRFLVNILRLHGYKAELLHNDGKGVVDEGLKNVHNDTCYPALLVIGQMIDALKSGKWDLSCLHQISVSSKSDN